MLSPGGEAAYPKKKDFKKAATPMRIEATIPVIFQFHFCQFFVPLYDQ